MSRTNMIPSIKIIVLVGIILLSISSACIIMVKNRRFEGKDYLVHGYGEWRIGEPRASAFSSMSNKDYWDYQVFKIYIPIVLSRSKTVWKDFTMIRAGVKDSLIRIDSITIVFLNSRDTIVMPPYVWQDKPGLRDNLIPGEVALFSPQGLFKEDYLCMFTDTITIPAEEDSIFIGFVVLFRDTLTNDLVKKPFEFTLQRREGKKLFLDVGR